MVTLLRAVLFDWDGTLVDSAAASYRCYVRLFARFGIRFDEDTFRRSYSPDWQRTYVVMGLPHDCWPEADRLWLELYAEERNELMPGAREALARLRDAGLAVGLVTSGERDRIEAELAGHGVAELFDVVVCGGDVANRKPHPEALEAALGSIDMPSVAAAYIGDSPEDVEMARAAGAYSVGVPGGFPNSDSLRASHPDLLATSLEEATRSLLLRSPPARSPLPVKRMPDR